jgi:hypothetical protein
MTLTDVVVKRIIRRLLKSQDYRTEVVQLINAEFLQFAINFFRRVVEAKLKKERVTADWYKEEFLNPALSSTELIIHSGLNRKTVENMYNSAKREIVLEATKEHYEQLYEAINRLVEQDTDIDITLSIKFRGVTVELNINESLIVINTLAVKRAELRGGAWSTAGKQVEKMLMLALCKLYRVPSSNYELAGLTDAEREVDFHLIATTGRKYRCEVKLMGKGNPESADATIARASDVFVADKLSDLNKRQLDGLKVNWIELRSEVGYKKFGDMLKNLGIPNGGLVSDSEEHLDRILAEVFSDVG